MQVSPLAIIGKLAGYSKRRIMNMKYVCSCGWEYNEAAGAPKNGIEPGTAWEDVPEDFACPLCGLGKDAFSKE